MKAVLILSGGLDSTTLLYKLRAQGDTVRALSVNYGQRHFRELKAASKLCEEVGVEHRIVDVTSLNPLLKGSSQTDSGVPVPHGHYAAESMKQTVVPNRNMLLLSIAGAWAISTKSNYVAYAAHGGDHAIYPDCRPEFVNAMQQALALADWHQVDLLAPFLGLTKADIVKIGTQLKVPFVMTYSCYEGRPTHCGLCGTCVERREAFSLAGVPDPTTYEVG